MRRLQGKPLLERFDAVAPPPLEVIDLRFGTIVVPVKQCGPIEEEMLAIACKLAQEQEGERVLAVNVVEVPLSLPLDAPIPGADEMRHGAAAADRVVLARLRRPRRVHGARSRAISGEVARSPAIS